MRNIAIMKLCFTSRRFAPVAKASLHDESIRFITQSLYRREKSNRLNIVNTKPNWKRETKSTTALQRNNIAAPHRRQLYCSRCIVDILLCICMFELFVQYLAFGAVFFYLLLCKQTSTKDEYYVFVIFRFFC